MTKKELAAITVERLEGWGRVIVENHATPMLLVGVGHDHVSGNLHLCIPEDTPISNHEYALILRNIAAQLEGS